MVGGHDVALGCGLPWRHDRVVFETRKNGETSKKESRRKNDDGERERDVSSCLCRERRRMCQKGGGGCKPPVDICAATRAGIHELHVTACVMQANLSSGVRILHSDLRRHAPLRAVAVQYQLEYEYIRRAAKQTRTPPRCSAYMEFGLPHTASRMPHSAGLDRKKELELPLMQMREQTGLRLSNHVTWWIGTWPP